MRRRKTIGRHIVKNERLLVEEKNYHTLETDAYILGLVFLLGH